MVAQRGSSITGTGTRRVGINPAVQASARRRDSRGLPGIGPDGGRVMKIGQAGLAVFTVGAGGLTALAAARRWQHWGASEAEITRPLPGDDLIPVSRLDSTQAITIDATPERIWPWLAQMGYEGRAGFYSYGILERRFGARDSRQLSQARPAPAPGGLLPFAPGAPLTVAVADAPRALVLWQVLAGGRPIDPARPWGDSYLAWSWAFVLEPAGASGTRLLTRMRTGYQPAASWAGFTHLLLGPAHAVMGRRQLLGIRGRAEAAGRPAARPVSSSRPAGR